MNALVKPLCDYDKIPRGILPYITKCNTHLVKTNRSSNVYYLDLDSGYYLKVGPISNISTESYNLLKLYDSKFVSEHVLYCEAENEGWLLTRKLSGSDCLHPMYLSNPKKLCECLGQLLFEFHSLPIHKVFPQVSAEDMIAELNVAIRKRDFDERVITITLGYPTVYRAFMDACNSARDLSFTTLTHGDYTFSNIILNNWEFSGLVDCGNICYSDKHFDLAQAISSIRMNVKDERYIEYFLDAYGRQNFDRSKLNTCTLYKLFCS